MSLSCDVIYHKICLPYVLWCRMTEKIRDLFSRNSDTGENNRKQKYEFLGKRNDAIPNF